MPKLLLCYSRRRLKSANASRRLHVSGATFMMTRKMTTIPRQSQINVIQLGPDVRHGQSVWPPGIFDTTSGYACGLTLSRGTCVANGKRDDSGCVHVCTMSKQPCAFAPGCGNSIRTLFGNVIEPRPPWPGKNHNDQVAGQIHGLRPSCFCK